MPTLAELRQCWPQVHERLQEAFQQLLVREWFARHTAVSEEDFARQPSRNRLSVLLSRTSHAAYHKGQLMLLK